MQPEKLMLTPDHQSTAPTTRTARPSARLGRLATTHRSAGAAVIVSCLLVAVVSATQLALPPGARGRHAELQRAPCRVHRLPGRVHDPVAAELQRAAAGIDGPSGTPCGGDVAVQLQRAARRADGLSGAVHHAAAADL